LTSVPRSARLSTSDLTKVDYCSNNNSFQDEVARLDETKITKMTPSESENTTPARQCWEKVTKPEYEYVDITDLDRYTTVEGDCFICNRRFNSK
jgi:hypothetical protein